MRIGKLENSELESLILNKFRRIRPESLTVPRVGEDCAALDFDGDLYGKEITLCFHAFLRPERKFDSLEELKMEIQKNALQTRKIFEKT